MARRVREERSGLCERDLNLKYRERVCVIESEREVCRVSFKCVCVSE